MSEFQNMNTQKSKNQREQYHCNCVSVVLIVMIVLFFMQRRQNQMVIGDIRAEKDSIQQELTQIVAGYDLLKTENDTINGTAFSCPDQSKKDLLIEVEQTKRVSYEKISDYQKQVTTLRGIMRDFVVQIDSLNKRNEQLMAENTQVKEQFKQSEMEKQQLTEEKDNLQKNLQRAAQLEARELIAEGLNNRSKETKYAKRTPKKSASHLF